LGAQSFPERAVAFAERMRRQTGGESCVRVTFRMSTKVALLAGELSAYARGASRMELAAAAVKFPRAAFKPTPDFPKEEEDEDEGASGPKGGEDGSRRGHVRRYFRAAGDTPDMVYFQAGAWDRGGGCTKRDAFNGLYL